MEKQTQTQWKTIIHFHYQKNETLSPAIIDIVREQSITEKSIKSSKSHLFWVSKANRRGIVRWAPKPLDVKSIFCFLKY